LVNFLLELNKKGEILFKVPDNGNLNIKGIRSPGKFNNLID